jgi:hypothetical protein
MSVFTFNYYRKYADMNLYSACAFFVITARVFQSSLFYADNEEVVERGIRIETEFLVVFLLLHFLFIYF